MHLFQLTELRKELVDLKRKVNNLDRKKRLELIQDACRSTTKEK